MTRLSMTTPLVLSLGLFAAACAGDPGYRPAPSASAAGFSEQSIEANRYQVSYRAKGRQKARDLALLRASELTLSRGQDWFQVVRAYDDAEAGSGSGPRTGVSVGGGYGSGGRSSVGLGVGIGLPLGNSSPEVTHTMEILIGRGPRPQDAQVYDAADVRTNLTGRY